MSRRKLSTNTIFLIIGIPDFIMAVIWAKFKETFPTMLYSRIIDGVVIFLFFLVFGILGCICVMRKEMPQGGVMLKGRPAVILGSILAIVSWFLALFALYRVFL
jgi:uncharacterized RDD family membrane protein YckC